MKKIVFCMALGLLANICTVEGMGHRLGRRFLKSGSRCAIRNRNLARMTPVAIQRLNEPYSFDTTQESTWPDYTSEQAIMINRFALKHFIQRPLNCNPAHDERELEIIVAKAAASVCPRHKQTKCSNCSLAQKMAIPRLREDLTIKRGRNILA